MTGRAYRQRIRESKARLDREMRAAVAECGDNMTAADVARVVREKTGAAIDPDYLRELMR